MMDAIIIVKRKAHQDAVAVASQAARSLGTQLAGNLRWYGTDGPAYREANTEDGRGVRVVEPNSSDPRAITVDL